MLYRAAAASNYVEGTNGSQRKQERIGEDSNVDLNRRRKLEADADATDDSHRQPHEEDVHDEATYTHDQVLATDDRHQRPQDEDIHDEVAYAHDHNYLRQLPNADVDGSQ